MVSQTSLKTHLVASAYSTSLAFVSRWHILAFLVIQMYTYVTHVNFFAHIQKIQHMYFERSKVYIPENEQGSPEKAHE